MQDAAPSDPFTAIQEAATTLHEVFASLFAAGFTEQQALYLTAQVMLAGRDDES